MEATERFIRPDLAGRVERFDLDSLIWYLPCTVRLLLVTDSGGYFDDENFGLGELRRILSASPTPWARFDVTTAHRRSFASADVTNFRFDTHDLSPYDQVWLFGFPPLWRRGS